MGRPARIMARAIAICAMLPFLVDEPKGRLEQAGTHTCI